MLGTQNFFVLKRAFAALFVEIETMYSTGKQQMGGWEHINKLNTASKFRRVATGGAGVWAVDSDDHIYYRYGYLLMPI